MKSYRFDVEEILFLAFLLSSHANLKHLGQRQGVECPVKGSSIRQLVGAWGPGHEYSHTVDILVPQAADAPGTCR